MTHKHFSDWSLKGIILVLVCFLALTVLNSCGGGGSGIPTGQFIDSPVQGLYYKTLTQEGFTDSEGRFSYNDGEQITFSIGDIILGHATGKEIITPLDLVPGAEDETNPTVTNILRFLQSLDTDCNLAVIQISETARTEIKRSQIESDVFDIFDVSVKDFNDSVAALFIHLNELNDCIPRQLRSAEESQEHFREVLDNSDFDGDGYTPSEGDCNDFDSTIHSDHPEICGDTIDQNCDGKDPECPASTTTTSSTSTTTSTSSTTIPATTTTTTQPTTTTSSTTTTTQPTTTTSSTSTTTTTSTTIPATTTTTTQPTTTTSSTSTTTTTSTTIPTTTTTTTQPTTTTTSTTTSTTTTTSSTTTTNPNDNTFIGMRRIGIGAISSINT